MLTVKLNWTYCHVAANCFYIYIAIVVTKLRYDFPETENLTFWLLQCNVCTSAYTSISEWTITLTAIFLIWCDCGGQRFCRLSCHTWQSMFTHYYPHHHHQQQHQNHIIFFLFPLVRAARILPVYIGKLPKWISTSCVARHNRIAHSTTLIIPHDGGRSQWDLKDLSKYDLPPTD